VTVVGPCPADDLLSRFIQNAVADDERDRVESHLDQCPTCSELLVHLAETYLPASDDEKAEPLFGRIDRYELIDILGRGAMGTVYEARDPVLGRHVAVKVIEHSGDEDRLLREGRALARVAHPHVVAVHDAGVDGGRVFIAMELVRGVSLRERLRDPALTQEKKLALFVGAARGLATAHAANVVHRDFKPENVVVGDTGGARVTDFGLARPARGEVPAVPRTPRSSDGLWLAELTTQGLDGTPAYLSPEQLDGRDIGAPSDQFSFAVALYEALFAAHPFGLGRENGPTTLAAVREAMNRPLHRPEAASSLPAFVWPVLQRALRVRPEERWPGMTELADALEGPDEKTRRLLAMTTASLSVAAVVHVILLVFVIGAIIAMWNEPPEPEGSLASTADQITGVIFFTWAPIGVPLALVSAFGVARHRSWAYVTTWIYAVISIPSCLGTAFSVFAFYVLTRPAIRRIFGR
jgi:serine/threonine protein kinase